MRVIGNAPSAALCATRSPSAAAERQASDWRSAEPSRATLVRRDNRPPSRQLLYHPVEGRLGRRVSRDREVLEELQRESESPFGSCSPHEYTGPSTNRRWRRCEGAILAVRRRLLLLAMARTLISDSAIPRSAIPHLLLLEMRGFTLNFITFSRSASSPRLVASHRRDENTSAHAPWASAYQASIEAATR